jgi:hypothetical protein
MGAMVELGSEVRADFEKPSDHSGTPPGRRIGAGIRNAVGLDIGEEQSRIGALGGI